VENKKSLEDALANMEAEKQRVADYQKEFAVEIEAENAKRRAFDARLAALTQEERRKVLNAAGMKHISAAPPPITPITGRWAGPTAKLKQATLTIPESQSEPASQPVTPAAAMLEQTDASGLSKRERQIRAIEIAATAQGYDALRVPTGGKKLLMEQCQKSNSELFGGGPHPFNGAWKVAIACDPPRLRMADHKKFAGK
jgi:hypothetical protein